MSARDYQIAKAQRDLQESSRLPKVKVVVDRGNGDVRSNDTKVALVTGVGVLAGQKIIGAATGQAANAVVDRAKPRVLRVLRRVKR